MLGPTRAASAAELQRWLDEWNAGDSARLNDLIEHLEGRLLLLSRRMLGGFPGVRRWSRESDVYQSAMIRLLRALLKVRPTTVTDLVGLAARQVRRELIDQARSFSGRDGLGSNLKSRPPAQEGGGLEPADTTNDLGRLASWCEFHRQVEALPEKERQAFDLIWYQGLTQNEAALALGVTERTVWQRWQSARLRLHDAVRGEFLGA